MALNASDRLVNLLGALALGVSDQIRSAIAEGMPLGGETAAALTVIGHAPALSIDQLSRVLRLSHAGTVRLVERLPVAAERLLRHEVDVEGVGDHRR